jgi:uncharacterized membrane protein YeiH
MIDITSVIAYIGTFVFALTGALKARSYQMDIFGAAVLSFVTAYGGGTIRDLLIGRTPVNWINDTLALVLVLGALLLVMLPYFKAIHFKKTIFITDAVGLGLFTIAGIETSLHYGANGAYALILGVITATFGGLVADILSNTIPDLLKKGELYATAAIAGGSIYIILQRTGISTSTAEITGVILVVVIRIISKIKRLQLPEI